MTSTNDHPVRDAVRERAGILLEHGLDGEWAVIDRFAQRVLRLASGDNVETARSRAVAFLEGARDSVPNAWPVADVHALVETFSRPDDVAALRRTLAAVASSYQPNLHVHFADPASVNAALMAELAAFRRDRLVPGGCLLALTGPYDVLDDELIEGLARFRVHVQVVHGWWPGCVEDDFTGVRVDAIRELSMYGLIASALWYVHGGNVDVVADRIEKCLTLNQHSGFAAPLQIQSPYARMGAGGPALSSWDDYIDLLMRLYEAHSHYDQTFFPLNEIAHAVAHGGWDPKLDVPTRMRILFRGDGSACCFRQIPAMGRIWADCGELAKQPSETIVESLQEFHRREHAWERNAFCGDCAWRHLCGGLDGPATDESTADDRAARELICQPRKLFLEGFLTHRLHAGAMAAEAL